MEIHVSILSSSCLLGGIVWTSNRNETTLLGPHEIKSTFLLSMYRIFHAICCRFPPWCTCWPRRTIWCGEMAFMRALDRDGLVPRRSPPGVHPHFSFFNSSLISHMSAALSAYFHRFRYQISHFASIPLYRTPRHSLSSPLLSTPHYSHSVPHSIAHSPPPPLSTNSFLPKPKHTSTNVNLATATATTTNGGSIQTTANTTTTTTVTTTTLTTTKGPPPYRQRKNWVPRTLQVGSRTHAIGSTHGIILYRTLGMEAPSQRSIWLSTRWTWAERRRFVRGRSSRRFHDFSSSTLSRALSLAFLPLFFLPAHRPSPQKPSPSASMSPGKSSMTPWPDRATLRIRLYIPRSKICCPWTSRNTTSPCYGHRKRRCKRRWTRRGSLWTRLSMVLYRTVSLIHGPHPILGKQNAMKVTSLNTQAPGAPQYIRYTPNQQGSSNVGETKIIRIAEAQVDPLEPPRFKHKKVPRGTVIVVTGMGSR